MLFYPETSQCLLIDNSKIIGAITCDGVTVNNIIFTKSDIDSIYRYVEKFSRMRICAAEDCNQKFVPTKHNQKFCSNRCRSRIHAREKIKNKS